MDTHRLLIWELHEHPTLYGPHERREMRDSTGSATARWLLLRAGPRFLLLCLRGNGVSGTGEFIYLLLEQAYRSRLSYLDVWPRLTIQLEYCARCVGGRGIYTHAYKPLPIRDKCFGDGLLLHEERKTRIQEGPGAASVFI